ncbi:MAG: hypothetical protein U1E83_00255 [Methylotetracoccus sp.]
MKIMSLTATAAVLAMIAVPVSAASLATGGVYGGPQQKFAYCYVFNAGASVSLGRAQIIDQNGNVVSGPGSCQGQFLPLKGTCQLSANIANNLTYGCRVQVSDQAAAGLRGTLDIRDASENVLVSSPLR